MKAKAKWLSFLLIVFWAGSAFSQLTVESNLINPTLEVFFLSGLDQNSGARQPLIFELIIGGTFSPEPPPHNVQISLEILKDGTIPLFRGHTGTFPVRALDLPMLRITNQQLFSSSSNYRIVDGKVADAGEDLIKDVLSTGKLPSGTYKFEVRLRDLTTSSINMSDTEFDLFISNPGRLDLIFPGHPAGGRRSDCPEIFTNIPQFRWEGDMHFYLVQIAEARPGEDPESALNQSPRFRRLFALQDGTTARITPAELGINASVEQVPTTSFQYPSSGEVLRFQPGKTYLWRVSGIINSSSGPIRVESEIFCFRIARLDQLGAGDQQLKLILRNLLGPSDFRKLFGDGGEFDGYQSVRISLDGREVTAAELLIKLNKANPQLKSYSVE